MKRRPMTTGASKREFGKGKKVRKINRSMSLARGGIRL